MGLVWTYSLDKLIPIGIFLSSGLLVSLINRSEMILGGVTSYLCILIIVLAILSFTRFRTGFLPSLKKFFAGCNGNNTFSIILAYSWLCKNFQSSYFRK